MATIAEVVNLQRLQSDLKNTTIIVKNYLKNKMICNDKNRLA